MLARCGMEEALTLLPYRKLQVNLSYGVTG